MRRQPFQRLFGLILGAVLIVSACSSSATPVPSATARPSVNVSMAATGAYYALAPAFVAASQGFFSDEGIVIDLQIIQPAAAAAGISGGGINFVVSASTDVVNLAAKKASVLAVAGFERYLVLDIIVSKAIWTSKSLSTTMPLTDKFKALKGMTVGTTGAGTSTQVLLDWMLAQVGLVPRDVTAITAATQGELRTLLETGRVDAFISGPPASITAEKDGVGKVFLRSSLGDIPNFGKDFIYEVNFTSKDYAEKNPDVVRRVNRALLRGVKFVVDQPVAAVIKAMGAPYAQANQEMLTQTMQEGKPGFDALGLMSEDQWKKAVEFFKLSGQDVSAVDTREGSFWTNTYLK